MSQIRRRMAETTNYEQCTTRYEIRNNQEFTHDVSSLAFLPGATFFASGKKKPNIEDPPSSGGIRRLLAD